MLQLRQKTTILYSTHILSDVQRVSDEVIIINKGSLVTQSSIEKLLAGKTAEYSLVTRGDSQGLEESLGVQAWIESIVRKSHNGQTDWEIAVNSVEMAEGNLLRLALDSDGVFVVDFGRRKHQLEEVFMSLVEEEKVG